MLATYCSHNVRRIYRANNKNKTAEDSGIKHELNKKLERCLGDDASDPSCVSYLPEIWSALTMDSNGPSS